MLFAAFLMPFIHWFTAIITQEVDNEEIIAMDIGTSYSRVAVVKQNGSVWISEKIPSMVSFTASGQVLIGERGDNPANTVTHIKQLYQKQLNNMPGYVQDLPYDVIEDHRKIYVKVCKISSDIHACEEKKFSCQDSQTVTIIFILCRVIECIYTLIVSESLLSR